MPSVLAAVLGGLLLAPPTTPPAAGATAEVEVAGEVVAYDEVFDRDSDGDAKIDQRAYYLGGTMVAAAIDTNGDGNMDSWLSFDPSVRARRVARDRDGDGAPEQVQALGADGRARGEAEALPIASAVQERALALPEAVPAQEPAPVPEAEPAFAVWRIYPLDWRLWTALGIFGVGLLVFGLSLRKR